jgi:predicted esterase
MTPAHEIDWWGGSPSAKGRFGHAARYGYIVIAPQYLDVGKFNYEGTPLEHDKVTRCLRDASRRFNIDSDRVFLSGHSIGGDAAWDIGLSHPDLWAGVIPINARAYAPTVNSYLNNAASVPLYFVNGELEGEVSKNNSQAWDRYFLYGYDVTLVKFLGRGSESFSDEILRLFGWMQKKNRFKDFRLQPKKFKVTTKRVTDNYFWAVEVNEFNSISLGKSLEIEGEFNEKNFLRITAPGKATIWLSPDVMNFSQPMQIILNGKSLIDKKMASPSIKVLLEDVRKRGERRHPFWVMLEGN